MDLVLSLKLPSFTRVGALIPTEELKDIVICMPLRGTGPCPKAHYCFLTVPLLTLHLLSSLISICLNLPFGTQRRTGRLKEAYFLQIRTERQGNDLYSGAPWDPDQFQNDLRSSWL